MMTCANAHYILSDLLINKVVGLGAVICALFGCLISVVTARCYTHDPNVSFASGFGGFSFGFSAGLAATGILSSGAKTILALWAENPEPLKRNHPEINQEFEQRIAAQFE
uniref:H(+)-exporting diphosphatase n=1 Tax=Zooxanthella nutricula TaxID=1333877 RepID=A0A7S2NBV0_9DINO